MTHLRVGTRKSPLALWQARHWVSRLQSIHPHITCELVPTSTTGDRTKGPLCNAGGKGLFSKDIHASMQQGLIDCAVHSLKDVETISDAPSPWQSSFVDPAITIAAVWRAGSPTDALITSRKPCHLVATDSIRRRNQLSLLMPEVRFVEARGNIATRLGLIAGEVDGTVLALAGLQRLGLWQSGPYLQEPFQHLSMTPLVDMVAAAGQGVLAVDALHPAVIDIVASTNDPACWQERLVERRVLQLLRADCHTSIGLEADASGVRWFYQGQFGVHPHADQPEDTASQLALYLQSLAYSIG